MRKTVICFSNKTILSSYGLHTLQGRYPAEIAASRLEKLAVQFLQLK